MFRKDVDIIIQACHPNDAGGAIQGLQCTVDLLKNTYYGPLLGHDVYMSCRERHVLNDIR